MPTSSWVLLTIHLICSHDTNLSVLFCRQFVERRRAALERYMNRTAAHPSLKADPDFREFLELDADLPKSSQTSALSGKSVMKLITKVGDSLSTMTLKMEETDEW